MPTYLWDTQANARHSVRLICDALGLSLFRTVLIDGKLYLPKDVICAVIMGESEFYNVLPNGNPTIHQNFRKDGTLGSTDWGICQINDRYHIGANSDFPSVDYVMANPDKAVEFMVRMYLAGHINWWCAYTSGDYKQYLPQTSG
jgi:hypothetical protein